MDDREKLKHLAEHWKEHNSEHAATYRNWATKIETSGPAKAYELLTRIADRVEVLDSDFNELIMTLS